MEHLITLVARVGIVLLVAPILSGAFEPSGHALGILRLTPFSDAAATWR